MAVAAAGSAIFALNIAARDLVAAGERVPGATQQGDQLIWIGILVATGCGLIQVAVALVDRYVERPRWLQVSRRNLTIATLGVLVVAVAAGTAVGGIDKATDEWQSFKRLDRSIYGVQGNTAQRLTATSGNGRYQYWQSAADAARAHPFKGIGAGTFEYWWAEHATIGGFIRNAHSLWMETLAELGYPGLLLIVALFGVPLVGGAVRMPQMRTSHRTVAAAAMASLAAFCLSATFDWVWQVTVLPVSALLCGAVLVAPEAVRHVRRRRGLSRVALVATACGAIVLIALPLAGLVRVRESQAAAQANRLTAALGHAETAHRVQPYAATPKIQEALLLEEAGQLDAAATAASDATRAERANWRTWLLLSRIEAERGHPKASVAAYRTARSLHPRSRLFKQ
jgi:O-antigen ligase